LRVEAGFLAKGGNLVRSFLPEDAFPFKVITDIRDTSPPADASDSELLEYFYTCLEGGERYQYHVRAAGHYLQLGGLVDSWLHLHHLSKATADVHLGFEFDHDDHPRTHVEWNKVAPRHRYADEGNHSEERPPHDTAPRTLYLTYKNEAGRLLALSQREFAKSVFCHEDREYHQALAFARSIGARSVIL
jgi:hypothetical protein